MYGSIIIYIFCEIKLLRVTVAMRPTQTSSWNPGFRIQPARKARLFLLWQKHYLL